MDDDTFEAHRIVLSACSPYFRQILTITKSHHPVIFLKDISADHVALLLKYMYLGQIVVKVKVSLQKSVLKNGRGGAT